MSNNSKPPTMNGQSHQGNPVQVAQQSPEGKANDSMVAPPIRRAAPGRRPLFRT